MAQQKMLSPNTTIWWVPAAAVASAVVGPTGDEIDTDGVNISCAIQTGYTLGATDSDTDDSRTICDEGNVTNFGFGNYEVDIPFFREGDMADTTSVFYTAFQLFKQPAAGFFVKRIGKKSTVAIEDGDTVSWFEVETDHTIDNDEAGVPKTFNVQGINTGNFDINVDVDVT